MIDNKEREHAFQVLEVLQGLNAEFQSIEERIAGRARLDRDVKEDLLRDLKSLKESLGKYRTRGKIDKSLRSPSRVESAFFNGPVHAALAHFRVRVGSDPIRSDWISNLYNSHADIEHAVFELRADLARSNTRDEAD